MATDREILKLQQIGALGTTPVAASPRTAIAEMHEQTFSFSNIAAADFAEAAFTMPKACRVKSIWLTPGATLAAHASNNITYTVAKRDGAGGAATTIGTNTTDVAGLGLTAFTPKTLALVAGTTEIAAGGVLTFKTVDNGTTTDPLVTCQVTVEWI